LFVIPQRSEESPHWPLFLPLPVLAVVCSLFVIPQRSGGICFFPCRCLFLPLPVLRRCLFLPLPVLRPNYPKAVILVSLRKRHLVV
jgi:hypothetical protein